MRPGSIMRNVILGPVIDRHVGPGAEVLDLGGYDGSVTEGLLVRGARVSLVDLDEKGVAFARAKGINAVCASADAIPFPDAHFDLVVCCDLLPCVPHAVEEPIFHEICRVLKPTGVLIMTVPDSALNLPFVDMVAAYQSWRSHEGVTGARLRELAAASNIEITEARDYFGLPSRLYYALAFFKNLPPRGTRLKRALFKQLLAAESIWCPAPQAHLIVARPKA